MKLRPKILVLVVGILLVSFAALSIPLYWYSRSALEDELDKRLLAVANIAVNQINPELANYLTREPDLPTVRAALERELSSFVVEGIEGLAVFSYQGAHLAQWSSAAGAYPQIDALLQSISGPGRNTEPTVSEIFQLPGGAYLKAAAVVFPNGESTPPVLVVWGGATFMSVIDQMIGGIFWIVLGSVIVAVSMTVVFSRSLARPVMELSKYANSIQQNIYSDPVDLERRDEFGDLSRSLIEMQKEIQQNEQSMKELLSGIAHEIKNPLGGIEIYTGLLEEGLAKQLEGKEAEEYLSYLEKVTEELRNLKHIVSEYLDYARPTKSHIKPTEVEKTVEDVHILLQPEMSQKRVRFTLAGRGVVFGDESKLRRVFLNLLKNSLDATAENGSISVDIHSDQKAVSIDVTDTGKGIPDEDISRIFEPYFTTQDKGHGLGLAIVKSIVDEMNGTIIVSSTVDNGTTFTLRFSPVEPNEQD
ncbi:ATP-binding protein [Candidatus Neomarinimicrobiota bacterium]